MQKEGGGLLREFADLIGDLLVLNILFLVCSLPLVTVGASFCGLYRSMLHRLRGEGNPAKLFFAGFRSDFGKSTAVWLIIAAFAAVLWGNYVFLHAADAINTAVIVILCILLFWVLASGCYLFPLMAEFQNTFLATWRNALLLTVTNFPKTLVLIALNCVFPLLALFKTDLFLRLLVAWLAFGVSVPAYFSSLILNGIFKPFLSADASTTNDKK